MRRTAASLAAALLLLTTGCGDGGAEPDAPDGRAAAPISLVLDFQPNAVHAGIYAAIADGAAIEVREPGSSSDAPKLLEAGRVDLAVMDINDLGIARERGADLVGDRGDRAAAARRGDRRRRGGRSGRRPTSPGRPSA